MTAPDRSHGDDLVRRGLSVAVSSFTADGRLGLSDLAYGQHTRVLRDQLGRLGYQVDVVDDAPADELGTRVRSWLTDTAGPGQVRVVHVLSHGVRAPATGQLHVAGYGGGIGVDTDLQAWVVMAADHGRGAVTLFLFDLCEAGELTVIDWDVRTRAEQRSAWVIAASTPPTRNEPHSPAFNAWLTRAAGQVLGQIADDALDLAGLYAPLATVADRVEQEVLTYAQLEDGPRQRVSISRVTVAEAARLPTLPFFPNPPTSRDGRAWLRDGWRTQVDAALAPYLDTIDMIDDPVHFLSRARGLPAHAPASQVSCFTGRGDQLTALARWLDGDSDRDEGNLRVVTASPGTGKSALLGILLAAAHPQLRPHTTAWHILPAAQRPNVNDHLAGVHARQRDVAAVRQSLIRQLHLNSAAGDSDEALLAAIAAQAVTPTIVLDALDEATDPPALHQLLLGLARARHSDGGGPACRLLVAARPWPQFAQLREAATDHNGLIDLDAVGPDETKGDIEAYIEQLLAESQLYQTASQRPVRVAIASTVAGRLASAAGADGDRWGAFLVAGMFTDHLQRLPDTFTSVEQAANYAATVPTTLPAVFELDLRTTLTVTWTRPVLTALAYGLGDGMPLSLVYAAATLLAGRDGDLGTGAAGPSLDDVTAVLDEARFYLRTSVDTDGTTLYRLFHQGLTDHLTAASTRTARSSTQDGSRRTDVAEALYATVPRGSAGQRRWDLAAPYLRRHLADHAAGTGLLDQLFADHEFLIHADPHQLGHTINQASTPPARLLAAAYRTSHHRHREHHDTVVRRGLLALDTLRAGDAELSRRVAYPSDLTPLPWQPTWATGGQTNPALRHTLTGHTGAVGAVACHRAEHTTVAVTGSSDGTARVWDLTTGHVRHTLTGHALGVAAVACYQLDERTTIAVTGSVDGTARMWDLTTGQLRHTLNGHTSRVRTVVCHRLDEHTTVAVTGCDNGIARVWDLTTGQLRHTLTGHTRAVAAVACHRLDEHTTVAITASNDATARVWDLNTGQLRHTLTGHSREVRAVACHQLDEHSTIAVTASNDGTARVWDLTSGQLRHTLTGHTNRVVAVACHRVDGHTTVAVTASDDGTARVWDLTTGQLRHTLTGHTRAVATVACHQLDGYTMVAVTASHDATARVWDLTTGQLRHTLTGHTGTVRAVACQRLAQDTTIAVTVGSDCTARVWDLANGQLRQSLTSHTDRVVAVAHHRLDEHTMVAITASWDRIVQVWDLTTGQLRHTMNGHTNRVVAASCHHLEEHPIAVTASNDATARVWDLTTGQLRHTLTGHTGVVEAVACQRLDEHTTVAITASNDATARVWDLTTGQLRHTLTGHTNRVVAVACHQLDQGTTIAITASNDATARVWDLTTGQLRHTLRGHTRRVVAVACHQLDQGTTIAITASNDATARVWDLTTGQLRHTLRGHTRAVAAVACHRLDEHTTIAVTVGSDCTARVWDLTSGQLRHTLTGHTNRVVAVACHRLDEHTTVAVTASDDGTARVWDLTDGRCVAVLACQSAVSDVCIADDGAVVVAFGWDVARFGLRKQVDLTATYVP